MVLLSSLDCVVCNIHNVAQLLVLMHKIDHPLLMGILA